MKESKGGSNHFDRHSQIHRHSQIQMTAYVSDNTQKCHTLLNIDRHFLP